MSLPLSLSAYRLVTRVASPLSGALLSLRLDKAKEDPMRIEERRGVTPASHGRRDAWSGCTARASAKRCR